MEIDHEIFSTVILSLPLIQEEQLSVSSERMCTLLVNRLEDQACPVNVWLGKLTALDMTTLGWLGRKTSTQTNKHILTHQGSNYSIFWKILLTHKDSSSYSIYWNTHLDTSRLKQILYLLEHTSWLVIPKRILDLLKHPSWLNRYSIYWNSRLDSPRLKHIIY